MSKKKGEFNVDVQITELVQGLLNDFAVSASSKEEILDAMALYDQGFIQQLGKEKAYQWWKTSDLDPKERIRLGQEIIKSLAHGIDAHVEQGPLVGLVNYLELKIEELQRKNKAGNTPVDKEMIDLLVMAAVESGKKPAKQRSVHHLADALDDSLTVRNYYQDIKLDYKPNAVKQAKKTIKSTAKKVVKKVRNRSEANANESQTGSSEAESLSESPTTSPTTTDTESPDEGTDESHSGEKVERKVRFQLPESRVEAMVVDVQDALEGTLQELIESPERVRVKNMVEKVRSVVEALEEETLDFGLDDEELASILADIGVAAQETNRIGAEFEQACLDSAAQTDKVPTEDRRDSRAQATRVETPLPPKEKEEMYPESEEMSDEQLAPQRDDKAEPESVELDEWGLPIRRPQKADSDPEMVEEPVESTQSSELSSLRGKLAQQLRNLLSLFAKLRNYLVNTFHRVKFKAYQSSFSDGREKTLAVESALTNYFDDHIEHKIDIGPMSINTMPVYHAMVTMPLEVMLDAISTGTAYDVNKLHDPRVSLVKKRAIVDRLGALIADHYINNQSDPLADDITRQFVHQVGDALEYASEYSGVLVSALRKIRDSDALFAQNATLIDAMLDEFGSNPMARDLKDALDDLANRGFVEVPLEPNTYARTESLTVIIDQLIRGQSGLKKTFEKAQAKHDVMEKKHAIAKVLGVRNETKALRRQLATANAEEREQIAQRAQRTESILDTLIDQLDQQPFSDKNLNAITDIQMTLVHERDKLKRIIRDAKATGPQAQARRFTHGAAASAKKTKGQVSEKLSKLGIAQTFKKDHTDTPADKAEQPEVNPSQAKRRNE